MRKEVVTILEGAAKGRGFKWTELIKTLGDQSSIKVDTVDFAEVMKGLENEGVLKVVGERDKRMIKKIDG